MSFQGLDEFQAYFTNVSNISTGLFQPFVVILP
jgi:hypothetical protein